MGPAWWTATCGRPAAPTSAAATCRDASRHWSTRTDMGRARDFGSARANRPRRAYLGSRPDGPATAAGAGPIVGRPGCGRTRGTAGPNLGLARARARALGAASAAIVGCAQACRPAAGGCALMGK
jgi:hypothetical protein